MKTPDPQPADETLPLQAHLPHVDRMLAESRMAVWRWDPDADTSRASSGIGELFGFPPGETLENSARGLQQVHPEDREEHRARVMAAVREAGSWHSEFRVVRHDGRIAWLEENARAVRDPDTGKLLLEGIVRDITERKEAEDSLRRSERQYRALFDSIEAGFCVFELLLDAQGRARDARILESNPAFHKLLGGRDPAGKTFLALFPGIDDSWFETYETVLKSRRPLRFEKHHAPSDHWYELYASPFDPDSNRLAVVFNPITGRKRTEAALRESEARKDFMMRLEDALRPLADAATMQETVCRMLGEHLRADRVFFAHTQEGVGRSEILPDYRRADLPSVAGPYDPADFIEGMEILRAGRVLRIDDLEDAADLSDRTRSAFRWLGAGALLSTPLHKDGRLQGKLSVLFTRPHSWSEEEGALVREVLERTWTAAKRARVEKELRESEEKYHTLFNSIDEAFCLIELIFDEDGNPVDFTYLETNPSFERHAGRSLLGKRVREEIPDYEQVWIDHFARAARTNVTVRLEHSVAGLEGQWFQMSAFRMGTSGSRVAVVFSNITERKREELALKDFNARLEEEVRTRTADLRQEKEQTLRQAQERLELEERQRLALLAATLHAQEEERKRLAESLHNGIGQLLYGVQLNLGTLDLRPGTPWTARDERRRRVTHALLAQAIEDVRRVSHELMPGVLEDFGLRVALEEACRALSGPLDVRCEFIDLPENIEPYMQVSMYRIAQELMNNIVRHAQAKSLRLRLSRVDGAYHLEASDDGRGFDPSLQADGMGLRALRAKVALLKGSFELESGVGGTTVRIRIPDVPRPVNGAET